MNDHEINYAAWIVYDALFAYCRQMVEAGMPEGRFKATDKGVTS